MRVASVDIGTNTLRLLIADVDDGTIRPVLYKRAITRLGGGYGDERGIDPASARRALQVLVDYAGVIKEHAVELVLPVATSVVRKAVNRAEFVKEASLLLGASVRVINGEEEAGLSVAGVLSIIDPPGGKMIVMDIGGGSTEYAFVPGDKGGFTAFSMEMGVVHLTESRLKNDPPTDAEARELSADIDSVLADLRARACDRGLDHAAYSSRGGSRLVGTAGTVTTLASVALGLMDYDPKKINNCVLPKRAVEDIYSRLLSMTIMERGELLSLEKGREDLIVSGAAIVLRTMDAFGFDSLTVSDAGLLEGIIYDRLQDDRGINKR